MSGFFHLYDESYLRRAGDVLGSMLDYAVYSLHQNAASFMGLFDVSGIAAEFEAGEPAVVLGMSGAELACLVMERCGLPHDRVRPRFTQSRSKEFLCGRALAEYQWEHAVRFKDITELISVDEILEECDSYIKEERRRLAEVWPPVTETDETRKERDSACVRHLNDVISDALKPGGRGDADPGAEAVAEAQPADRAAARLREARAASRLSQSRLAAASGVPVRTIQQYEQSQKNLAHASADTVRRLAAALGCRPEDLV